LPRYLDLTRTEFQQHPKFLRYELLIRWSYEGVSILSRKISKLSTTFVFFISPGSTLNSVSRVLRDRRQSKSESVFKLFPLVHCVPMIIISSLFIGFECMNNEWKVEKVNYEFGIGRFLRLYLD
jgi:hypothetical protein